MSQLSFSLVDEVGDPTFSVTELNSEVARAVRRAFPEEVWVRGEIRGLKRSAAGHVYFTLVERGDDGDATLQVNLFNRARQAVDHMLTRYKMRLADGIEVRVHGAVEFYGARGQINLRMGRIDPTYTLGRLAADRDAVIGRLVAEGLVEANRRIVAALAPVRVGLVTSVGSAAFHDFTHELAASGFGFTVVVADARVQGLDASRQLASGIAALDRAGVDLIALVRGGGAKTDLAAFDDEHLARAIAASSVPVLTGIGHEIDSSIADLVAHRAWKTPTACAGAIVEQVRRFVDRVDGTWSAIAHRADGHLAAHRERIESRARRLARDVGAALDQADQRADFLARRVRRESSVALADAEHRLERVTGGLEAVATRTVTSAGAAVEQAERRLARVGPRRLDASAVALESLAARIDALDPARLLARGWSITHTVGGTVVRSTADAPPGTELVTTVLHGTVASVATASPTAVQTEQA